MLTKGATTKGDSNITIEDVKNCISNVYGVQDRQAASHWIAMKRAGLIKSMDKKPFKAWLALHPYLDDDKKIFSDELANAKDSIQEICQNNTSKNDDPMQSMPQWIEYPMKDRNDWENIIKPRLDAKIAGRYPQGSEWDNYVKEVKNRDYPLGIWTGSFYGWPRSFMGVERISTMFFDDPDLIHEICEHIADFVIEQITPILESIELDFAFIWEDMGCKNGPLCSPKIYREFMLNPLKRVTNHLRQYGIDIIIIDSDGNNDVLVPLWLEAGVNGLRPFEIASDCDPIAIREKYGKELIIQGGIDKRVLSKSFEDIESEILSKVPYLCIQGGYFPQVDHLVPPDVPLDNYKYYSQLMRKVVEEPEKYLHEAKKKGI